MPGTSKAIENFSRSRGAGLCGLLAAAVCLAACGSFGKTGDRQRAQPAEPCVFHAADGTLVATGAWSAWENREFLIAALAGQPLPPWREFLRLGRWEFRYPSGQVKAVLSFEIDWYTDCCTAGLCRQAYEVRTGDFAAWWPDGAPLARGSFARRWERIETSCAGGDLTKRAVFGRDVRFWDQNGNPAEASILEVAGVSILEL